MIYEGRAKGGPNHLRCPNEGVPPCRAWRLITNGRFRVWRFGTLWRVN